MAQVRQHAPKLPRHDMRHAFDAGQQPLAPLCLPLSGLESVAVSVRAVRLAAVDVPVKVWVAVS